MPAVGKITTERTGDELAIGRAIMALPLADLYFALPTERCTPVALTPAQEEGCPVIMETKGVEGTKLDMLIMPNGGKTIEDVVDADPAHFATVFKKIMIHLLEGGIIYQNAGYVHNDIHPGNVLVDQFDVARYIDFGLAFKPATITSWTDAKLGRTFRPKYVWTAPEIHALRIGRLPFDTAIAELRKHREYQLIERWCHSDLSVDAQKVVGRTGTSEAELTAFLKENGKKIDAWRLGLIIVAMWDELLKWPGFVSTAVYKEREAGSLWAVMKGLVKFDPIERLSLEAALAQLNPPKPKVDAAVNQRVDAAANQRVDATANQRVDAAANPVKA